MIQQVGAPLELYDRPRNRFVAGFLGSPAMNFLAGAVETDGDVVRALCAGHGRRASGRGRGRAPRERGPERHPGHPARAPRRSSPTATPAAGRRPATG